MHASKRAFDLIASTAALVLLAPLMGLIAMLVRLFIGAPVLFRQQRPGYRGRPFVLYKFRTMADRTAPDGTLLPDEQRLVPFGRFLRAFSLDEWPELINILRGEMSVVGPRPLLMEYLERYSADQMRRHEAVPGLTGWAQVHGRNRISWEETFQLDLWYVDHWSFGLDLKIILLTLWKVIRREGVSQVGHATRQPFRGSGPSRD